MVSRFSLEMTPAPSHLTQNRPFNACFHARSDYSQTTPKRKLVKQRHALALQPVQAAKTAPRQSQNGQKLTTLHHQNNVSSSRRRAGHGSRNRPRREQNRCLDPVAKPRDQNRDKHGLEARNSGLLRCLEPRPESARAPRRTPENSMESRGRAVQPPTIRVSATRTCA